MEKSPSHIRLEIFFMICLISQIQRVSRGQIKQFLGKRFIFVRWVEKRVWLSGIADFPKIFHCLLAFIR